MLWLVDWLIICLLAAISTLAVSIKCCSSYLSAEIFEKRGLFSYVFFSWQWLNQWHILWLMYFYSQKNPQILQRHKSALGLFHFRSWGGGRNGKNINMAGGSGTKIKSCRVSGKKYEGRHSGEKVCPAKKENMAVLNIHDKSSPYEAISISFWFEKNLW